MLFSKLFTAPSGLVFMRVAKKLGLSVSFIRKLAIIRHKRMKCKRVVSIGIFLLSSLYAALIVISFQKITSHFYSTRGFQPKLVESIATDNGEYQGNGANGEKWMGKRINSTDWEKPWPLGDDKKIIDQAYLFNLHHEIFNEARYGWLAKDEETEKESRVNVVIVVQVHDRSDYLRYLVKSLSEVRGIEQALLVFSHDLVSPSINQLIRNITFARVIQLLYPYSIQFFPDRFPGQAPDDCPEYIKPEDFRARKLGCKNWKYPGRIARYRTAAHSQLKHHHWWKLNYFFDGIVKRYGLEDRMVLLLEEDEMVAPDLLHVLELMDRERTAICSECQILSLGNIENLLNKSADLQLYRDNIDKFSVRGCEYYRGMAINAAWWWQFREACGEAFCIEDEYSMHWTLHHLSRNSLKCTPMRELRAESPRVIHVGECGMHLSANDCRDLNSVALARRIFADHSAFFPDELHLVSEWKTTEVRPKGRHGGWGDFRDHELCRLNTHPFEPITPPSATPERRKAAQLLFRL